MNSGEFEEFCHSFHYFIKQEEIISTMEQQIAEYYFAMNDDYIAEMNQYLSIPEKK
jgi:hypothetical protein